MQNYRISTDIGKDKNVVIELKSDYDLIEVLENVEYTFDLRYNSKKIICVYGIKNIINNKIYIGSTIYFRSRILEHCNTLQKNKHTNRKLQRAWNKYGEKSFRFIIIKKDINENEVISYEQYFIDKFDSCKKGYNIVPVAGTTLGHKWTKEKKEKYSKLKKSLNLGEPIIQYSLDGQKINEFENMRLASKSIGHKNSCNIGMCCRKEKITVGGYKWEYKDRDKQKLYGFQEFETKEIIPCPHCNNKNTIKRGFVYWNQSKEQQYKCLDCLKVFNKKTKTPNAWNVDVDKHKKIVDYYNSNNYSIDELSDIFNMCKQSIKRILTKYNAEL